MTLLLLPVGVQSVRAEDGDGAERPVRVDALPVPSDPVVTTPSPAVEIIKAGDGAEALQPGVGGVEVQPGVIVLNTRGYNYTPESLEMDPAAMAFELEAR